MKLPTPTKSLGRVLYLTEHSAYNSWARMMSRCFNINDEDWDRYGGAGINVCVRWCKAENFIADMGEHLNGHELDRVDSSGNYEPSNCRRATRTTQNRNRRNVTMTVELAQQIRQEFPTLTGKHATKVRALAIRYPCSEATIYAILAGRNWNQSC